MASTEGLDFVPCEQIRELVPESQAYMDLLAFERKLDQTIMRKRVDIQEALKRPMKVQEILTHTEPVSLCFTFSLTVHIHFLGNGSVS